MLVSSSLETYIHGGPSRNISCDSDSNKLLVNKGVCDLSKLGKVGFVQNVSNFPRGILSSEG